jgi:hypothetical protein
MIIDVQNDFISSWLNEGMWKKTEQSLIQIGHKKIDKISIWHISENHQESEMVFVLISPSVSAIKYH